MRPRTLQGRLIGAAVLAVVVAVACLGVTAEIVVSHRLRSSLDSSLRRQAQDVARLSVSAPALLTAPGALDASVSGRQLSVEVLDRHGRLLARSVSLGAKLLPQAAVAGEALRLGRSGFADARLDRDPVRLFAAPLPDEGGPATGGVVLVASSTTDIDATLHRLSLLLLLSGLVAAVVGAGAAAWLTRRGLRPVARLSAAAAEIERTGDPARRLPEPDAEDEVGELAGTLNRMLAALDAARRRERRFLADASHELRTPLTSLAGNVDFVARHGVNPEVLADLELDTRRLQRLVDDLLALEREDAGGAPEGPVRLDRIVTEPVGERRTVTVSQLAAVTVRGEPLSLRRALDNLLDNAEIHGPRGGAVTIALTVDGGTARLSVSDEGPGFAAGDVEHAFERFWRGPDALARPGSGLGLAIVRAIAERHGGTVSISGSTVEIALPAVEEGAEAEPRAFERGHR